MPTPREFIADNCRRTIANMPTTGLQYSTDDGAAWLPFVGDAVLHADTADLADFDPDLGAEGTRHGGQLKVADDATTLLEEGDWVKETATTPMRVWECLGFPSQHSGKRVYRLGFLLFSPGQNAGPNRGQTR